MTAQESKLSNAYESTITTALTADVSGITISVDTAPTDSTNTAITGSVVMYLVLDPDSDSQREYVKVTNISGTTLTVQRNIDTGGGGLRTHSAGAKIRQVAQAQHFDDIHDRIDKVINEDGSSLNTTTGVVKDEDDMVSDSATHLATQQSIKAYVDAQVTAQDLDFQGDTGGVLSIDLDSESLTVSGGTGVSTSGSGNTITVNTVDSEIDHDSLNNYDSDEHVAHSFVTLTAGAGLTADSGGNIAASRSFAVGAGTGIIVNTNDVSVDTSVIATRTYVDSQVSTVNTLGEMTDVTLSSLANGDLLQYNSSSSQWNNTNEIDGGPFTGS